jgi:hypothetical protein
MVSSTDNLLPVTSKTFCRDLEPCKHNHTIVKTYLFTFVQTSFISIGLSPATTKNEEKKK